MRLVRQHQYLVDQSRFPLKRAGIQFCPMKKWAENPMKEMKKGKVPLKSIHILFEGVNSLFVFMGL